MTTFAERVHFFLASLGDYIFILLPLGVGLALLVPPAILTQAFIISLGFQAFFVDIGTTITATRVLSIAALLSLLLAAPAALVRAWRNYPGRDYLIMFMLFLGASIILNLPFLPEKDVSTTLAPVNDTFFRGRVGRGLFQWLVIALRAATPLLVIAFCRRFVDTKKLLRVVLCMTTVVCLYGLYQVVAYYQDLPAIYIYRGFNDPTGRHLGLFHISSPAARGALPIFRISSLLGEPRELAAFLIPPTTFLGVLILFKRGGPSGSSSRRRWLVLFALFLLHAAVLLGTFSTNGWVAIGISIFALWWFLRGTRGFARLLAVLGVASLAFGVLASFFPHIWSVVDTRLLDRLSLATVRDPIYGIPQLLHMIQTWPHTLFVGASPGGSLLYEDYLGSEIGFVHYITDLGVIGTGILILFLVQAFRAVAPRERKRNTADPYALALASAVLAGMVSLISFTGPEVVSSIWLFLGLAAAYRATKGEIPSTS